MTNENNNPNSMHFSERLTQLLSSDVTSEELTQQLFDIDVEQARASDPLLAEVLPLCAIPASFDADIIGVLRDAPAETETNTRLLGQLAPFNYVQAYDDGSYAYHDTVREMLLARWQQPEHQAAYDQIRQRLAAFYFERGKAQYRAKDYQAALASLNDVLDLHEDIQFYRWRGIVYVELQQSEEAIQDLGRALAEDPDDGLAIGHRGCAYYWLEQYDDALHDLTRAIALPPDPERGMSEAEHYGLYYHWRGRVSDAQQDYAAALTDFSEAIELQPENGHRYLWRGVTYYQQQDYAAALADFSKAIELQPDDGDNYRWRGIVYDSQQDYAAVITDFTKAIELQPEDGDNYFWRGSVSYDQQDYAAALTDFSRAIELQPEDVINYRGRGRVYRDVQDYPAALADFTKAIKLQSDNGDNYYWRGHVYYDQQDYAAALTDFAKAIELQPLLARSLLRDNPATSIELAHAWAAQFGRDEDTQAQFVTQVEPVAADFLALYEQELRARSEFQPLFDSRALDTTAAATRQTAQSTAEIAELLQRLLEQITRRHTPEPGHDKTLPARYQLRAPVADFVGRAAEMNDIVQAFTTQQDIAPVVGIFGMPGVGKTEVAYAAAARAKALFPDAQLVVDMLGTSAKPLTVHQALYKIIRAFYPDQPLLDSLDEATGVYRSLLHNQHVLVLLDNVAPDTDLTRLLPPPGSALLITGRTIIQLPGMHTLHLGLLRAADSHTLVRIICKQLSQSAAERLAAQCGRLPLAMRIAAEALNRDQTHTPTQYIRQLKERRLALLKAPGRPDDPKRSVAASITLSYDMLTSTDQHALRVFSIFPTHFDLSAAAALIEQPLDVAAQTVSQLYHRGLLGDERRFKLHDLVRDFAFERLRNSSADEQHVRLRHAQHYATVVQMIKDQFEAGTDEERLALRRFDRERPQIGAGWRWARRQEPPTDATDELLLAYGIATMNYGALRYHPQWDRIPQYEAMRAAARRLQRRKEEAIALTNLGHAYADAGDYHTAITSYEDNLTLVRAIDNRKGEGIVLGNLGRMYTELGQYDLAIALHEQNLEIARAVQNRRGEGIALGNLGYALTQQGEPARAIPLHQEQVAIARELHNQREVALALSHLGLAQLRLGELEAALATLQVALTTILPLGDRMVEGRIYDRLGQVHILLEKFDEAVLFFDNAISLADAIGDRAGSVRTRWRQGELLVQQGNSAAAIALMQPRVDYEREIAHALADTNAARLAQLRNNTLSR